MYYFINEMKIGESSGRYFILDSIEGKTEFINNRWLFTLNINVCYDGIIPSNFILGTFNFPTGSCENLTLINNSNDLPYWWKYNKQYYHSLYVDFYLDTNIDFNSYEFFIKTSLNINKEYDNDFICNNKQQFSNEVNLSSFCNEMCYNSSWNIYDEHSYVYDQTKININHDGTAYLDDQCFEITQDNFLKTKINYPIIDLAKIYSLKEKIYVKKYTINVIYNEKTEKITKEINEWIDNELYIKIDSKFLYDLKTKTMVKNNDGIEGIFFPIEQKCDIKIEINYISKNNNEKTLNIYNNLSFENDDNYFENLVFKVEKYKGLNEFKKYVS